MFKPFRGYGLFRTERNLPRPPRHALTMVLIAGLALAGGVQAACLAPADGTLAVIEDLAFREPAQAIVALDALKGIALLADPRRHAQWHAMSAEAQRQLSHLERTLHHARAGVALLAGDSSSDLAVRLRTVKALVSDDALAKVEYEALATLTADRPLALGCVLRDRGWARQRSGDIDGALADLMLAHANLGQYGSRDEQHVATGRLATVYQNGGDGQTALALIDETVQHSRDTGAAVRLGTALARRAMVLMQLKRPQEAEASAREALALAESRGELAGAGQVLTTLCRIKHLQGQAKEALALCDRSEAVLLRSGTMDNDDRAMLVVQRAEVSRGLDLSAAAMANLQGVIRQADDLPPGLVARAQAALALAHQASGNYRAAFEAQRAFLAFQRTFNDSERINAQALMRARFGTQRAEKQSQQLSQDKQLAEGRLWMALGLAAGALVAVAALVALAIISRKQRQRLRRLAEVDDLTGLPNRRKIVQTAMQQLANRPVGRSPGHPDLVLGVIDVDWFKSINDRFGHVVGDQVLKQLATMAPLALQGAGSVGRYGGEEFLLVLPACDVAGATEVAERLRAAVAAFAFSAGTGEPLQFTVSIGLAAARTSDTAFDQVVQRADSALYRAKAGGRNRVELFDAANDPLAPPRPSGHTRSATRGVARGVARNV